MTTKVDLDRTLYYSCALVAVSIRVGLGIMMPAHTYEIDLAGN